MHFFAQGFQSLLNFGSPVDPLVLKLEVQPEILEGPINKKIIFNYFSCNIEYSVPIMTLFFPRL